MEGVYADCAPLPISPISLISLPTGRGPGMQRSAPHFLSISSDGDGVVRGSSAVPLVVGRVWACQVRLGNR